MCCRKSNAIRNNRKFDPSNPCLVLAPHLEYPLRSGDNILIDKRWSEFSRYVPFIDVIGKDTITRYQNGHLVDRRQYNNNYRSKYHAVVRTCLRRSHYLLEKFVTSTFVEVAHKYLADDSYRTVIFSYVWTASVLSISSNINDQTDNRFYLAETINDEVKWYQNMRLSSKNPIIWLTAILSEKWIKRFLSVNGNNFLFLHLTEVDWQGYLEYMPDHAACVAPVGADIEYSLAEHTGEIKKSNRIRLIFVGSLGVKINYDALVYFSNKFYPLLRQKLDQRLEIIVAGSNPTNQVRRLCRDMDWQLYANISDDELRHLYSTSIFSILPFEYTTGAKLKLLKSLANGVPFLATTILSHQINDNIYPSLFSDIPEEWLERIVEVDAHGVPEEAVLAMSDFVKKYTWSSVTRQLFEALMTIL